MGDFGGNGENVNKTGFEGENDTTRDSWAESAIGFDTMDEDEEDEENSFHECENSSLPTSENQQILDSLDDRLEMISDDDEEEENDEKIEFQIENWIEADNGVTQRS